MKLIVSGVFNPVFKLLVSVPSGNLIVYCSEVKAGCVSLLTSTCAIRSSELQEPTILRGPDTSTVTVAVLRSVITIFRELSRISSPTSSTLTPRKVCLYASVSWLMT